MPRRPARSDSLRAPAGPRGSAKPAVSVRRRLNSGTGVGECRKSLQRSAAPANRVFSTGSADPMPIRRPGSRPAIRQRAATPLNKLMRRRESIRQGAAVKRGISGEPSRVSRDRACKKRSGMTTKTMVGPRSRCDRHRPTPVAVSTTERTTAGSRFPNADDGGNATTTPCNIRARFARQTPRARTSSSHHPTPCPPTWTNSLDRC